MDILDKVIGVLIMALMLIGFWTKNKRP